LHVTHISKLSGLLSVEDLAVGIEDSQRRNTLFEGNSVSFGDVDVLVEVAYVDVDEHEVLLEEVDVGLLMEVDVEDLAVAAPVAAEVEDDALVFEVSLLKGSGDVGFGVGVGGV